MKYFFALLLVFAFVIWRDRRSRRARRAERDADERIKHEERLQAMRPKKGPYDREGKPVYAGWYHNPEVEAERQYLLNHPENRAEQQHLLVTDDTKDFLLLCAVLVGEMKEQDNTEPT